jgi:hypothetical protein
MREGGRSLLGGAQFRTRYRDCMGKTDRASCATNFQHFIIIYVRTEGYRCYAGSTPRRCRTHVRTNAKDKLRPFATNSAFCRGFEPWTVCYFQHHPTTQPHVTQDAYIQSTYSNYIYCILRSLRYIYTNPLRFPISSLGLPNFSFSEKLRGSVG